MFMSFSKFQETAKDRETWHAQSMGSKEEDLTEQQQQQQPSELLWGYPGWAVVITASQKKRARKVMSLGGTVPLGECPTHSSAAVAEDGKRPPYTAGMTSVTDRCGWGPHSAGADSVQFSRSVVSDSLRPHELQHAKPSCPSPTPGVHTNPCPLCR